MKKSKVWEHYPQDGDTAKCSTCKADICCKGGCTSAMRNHCCSKHKIGFDITETAEKKCRTENDITHFIKKESLAEIFSKLAAVDEFSFHGIIKSEFIRSSLKEKGYSPRLCPKTITSFVTSFGKSIKE